MKALRRGISPPLIGFLIGFLTPSISGLVVGAMHSQQFGLALSLGIVLSLLLGGLGWLVGIIWSFVRAHTATADPAAEDRSKTHWDSLKPPLVGLVIGILVPFLVTGVGFLWEGRDSGRALTSALYITRLLGPWSGGLGLIIGILWTCAIALFFARDESDASQVLLRKCEEDENSATFLFGPSEDDCGRLMVEKRSGKVIQLEPVPSRPDSFYLLRAKKGLIRQIETNEWPDLMIINS